VKLVGFDALTKTREIALVRGWRSWTRLPYTRISAVSKEEFQLERLRIRNGPSSPADWVIHDIRLDNDSTSTLAGEVSGADLSNERRPLVLRPGRRFELEVEYVGPLTEGAVFEPS
jgi:hypothetical protein